MIIPTQDALERHKAACEAEENGYVDPDSGYFVMTSFYLRSLPECCGSGCRHCPWSLEEQTATGRPKVESYPWPK